MRLITLQGTSDTQDGTGLIPELLEARLKLLPPDWTARICYFKDIDPMTYLPAVRAVRAAGGRLMHQPMDSQWMADLSILEYGQRVEDVIDALYQPGDTVEYANEINGQRHDSWTGHQAYEKAIAGLAACRRMGVLRRAITYYYDCDNPEWMSQWVSRHPSLPAEYAMVSYYPSAATPVPSDVISWLAKQYSGSLVAIGEYGAESFESKDSSAMIECMENRTQESNNDVVGGGYWDFYRDVVAATDDGMLKLFQRLWS